MFQSLEKYGTERFATGVKKDALATKVDLNNMIVMTTFPPVGAQRDPGGHTECFVPMATKTKILSTRRFPSAVPKPQVGELIFAERALLMSPQNLKLPKPIPHEKESLYDCDSFAASAVTLAEWEKLVEKALTTMTPGDQIAYNELVNSHQDDKHGPLLGIRRTNNFGMPTTFTHTEETYCGVLKIGSRVNHSRKPNIMNRSSVPSFSFQFWATVDIKAGDELFFLYWGVDQSKAERQAELTDYGFKCECPACTHVTSETDKLRQEFIHRVAEFMSKNGYKTTSEGRSQLDQILEFREALIKEGLNSTAEYIATIRTIVELCNVLGLMAQSRSFREEERRLEKSLTNFVNAHDFILPLGPWLLDLFSVFRVGSQVF